MSWVVVLATILYATAATAQTGGPAIVDMKDRSFTADEVKKALAPTPQPTTTTRGAGGRTTRSIQVEAAPPAQPRKLSMQLHFAFDSAAITEEARSRLDALGEALQSPELVSGTYVISGHTDSSGRYDYNVSLSKRRAEAVTEYLVSKFQIERSRIIPVGKGPDDLLDRGDPKSAANRRVQIEARQ